MSEGRQELKETDHLKYKGNEVPRLVRLWWTVVIIFSVVYLVKYMLPDLSEWIKLLK